MPSVVSVESELEDDEADYFDNLRAVRLGLGLDERTGKAAFDGGGEHDGWLKELDGGGGSGSLGKRRRPSSANFQWEAIGCNECFRLSKYFPGDRFAPHVDTYFRRTRASSDSSEMAGSSEERSQFTVNIYLNEVS